MAKFTGWILHAEDKNTPKYQKRNYSKRKNKICDTELKHLRLLLIIYNIAIITQKPKQ